MKKLLFAVVITAITMTNAFGQFEAKINPLGALFGQPDISAEYIVSDVFGVEASVGFAFGKAPGASIDGAGDAKQSGLGFKVSGKYYFSPDEGGDGWYGGLYLRQVSKTIKYENTDYESSDFKKNIFAGGVEFGKKWVFDTGFLIEAAFGVGRPFSEKREYINSNSDYDTSIKIGIDFTGKFAIGYRFN